MSDKRQKALSAMSNIFSEIMFEHINKQKSKESEEKSEESEEKEEEVEKPAEKDVKSPAWMTKHLKKD